MAPRTAAAVKKTPARGKGKAASKRKTTLSATDLFARVPKEDVKPFGDVFIEAAGQMAFSLAGKHRKGSSLVAIDSDGLSRGELGVSVVTVVNDNMPFLFDSVLGAVADKASEPFYVLHPVLHVHHTKSGVSKILGVAGGKDDGDADRISLIQICVPRLSGGVADALKDDLEMILLQVRDAVAGWRPMLARIELAIADYRYSPPPLMDQAVAEAIAFMEWLRDDNFTFLGMREYKYSGGAKSGKLERADKEGLGILRDPELRVLRRGLGPVTTTPEIRAFLNSPEPLIVTKSNTKSVVHRRGYLDYVGIKTFDKRGKVSGELRIVGLFTSTAYTRSVLHIPYLRSKANNVISRFGFDLHDHSGKALLNVLESYPRDELFQIDEKLLAKNAEVILRLGERPRIRALTRIDPFERFVSVIVFIPRDRYDSIVREKIGTFLKNIFDGRLSAFYPAFPEGALARVHFIIGRSGGKTPRIRNERLEDEIRQIVRTWEDQLTDAAIMSGAEQDLVAIARAMPESYRDSFSPQEALLDAEAIAPLGGANPIKVRFFHEKGDSKNRTALKIFHHGSPVVLSERVPLLEDMGFGVISERTYECIGTDGSVIFIHDMELKNAFGSEINLSDGGALFEELFMAIWRGEADQDSFNALVQTARLSASEIVILRAYGRYLRQAGVPYSQGFIAAALNRYPHIARNLHDMFWTRFDPDQPAKTDRTAAVAEISAEIEHELQHVPSLDDDRIIRRYRNLIESTLRTNAFAPPPADGVRSLAFKLDPRSVEGLPEPRPWREIFVYGAEVEGVHLRFGPVARGGLRWSDRAQDYRTEVLGLVKAQQVKNAVIVPVGAKGGFYPKRLPASGSRDEIFEAGRAAYINFISSLLSITDNLDGAKVVPPQRTVRHDGDDPYFVVAADKGTATFSDTANAISQAHGFWLDDAFASGGSAGYDHKKMGITARGAWEAVKRHFREMDVDIQSEPFSVVGVGDMSGDVFGNGMLLSHHIRLIAAFDHRDIFIDPDPDPKSSFAERKRLFELGRSSWQDYDVSKLSRGGIIVSRSEKSITLSKAAADAIGLGKTTASPFEIMTAILKSEADLLWFGGIGTYIRATTETDQQVGDRANDAIRITAPEVRAKVIGEGANLGLTQKARIEYGLNGGRCNSDAIDNSGGVNSSDVEVNIKIALANAMRSGKLKRPARDRLLAEMTDEVARLVLRNNYGQTLSISLTAQRGLIDLPYQSRLMTILEGRNLLDRKVEYLPDEQALTERAAKNQYLTRAEIGVLLAYAKIVLFDDLLATTLPDDPYLERELLAYFPEQMVKRYPKEISSHRLRREIIATRLVNNAINRGSATFVSRLQDLTGATVDAMLRAYVIVRDGFELSELYGFIDALDTRIGGNVQNQFYATVDALVHSATNWFVRHGESGIALATGVGDLRKARTVLEPEMESIVPGFVREEIAEALSGNLQAGAPEPLARRLALLPVSELVPDIALVARQSGASLQEAARTFFDVTEQFRIGRIEAAARSLIPADYYDNLAIARAKETIATSRRDIAVKILASYRGKDHPAQRWFDDGRDRLAYRRDRLGTLVDSGEITLSRLTVASGMLADLAM